MASNTEEDGMELIKKTPQPTPRKYKIVYPMVFVLAYWHMGGLYGLYLMLTSAHWATILYNWILYMASGWGITAGTHRLWCHRAYKAKLPLQILLMLFHTYSCQSSVINWARDHRLHHKYCDTDADPYNSTRGFFYSHMGWLLVRKHPELLKKAKTIDLSDLLENPVLRFQKKYYYVLVIVISIILPAAIPVIFWQESIANAHFISILHILIGAHVTFSINSVAHIFGSKPYDKNITPVTNVTLSALAFGEGYHNYHHVFPFDYRTAELGNNFLNFSTAFIDFCGRIGWAYDMKQASNDIIVKRALKTGDGSDLWGRVSNDKLMD